MSQGNRPTPSNYLPVLLNIIRWAGCLKRSGMSHRCKPEPERGGAIEQR
jgi:hypothetical protein